MSDLQQSEVAVDTSDEQLMKCLRARKFVHKDEVGEFIWGQFNGRSLPFYLEKPRLLPAEAAKWYVRNSKTEVHVDCPECDGKKRTIAGPCLECKGTGVTHSLQAGGYPKEALRIMRTYDLELREAPKGEQCPFCPAHFDDKPSLLTHLQTKCAVPKPVSVSSTGESGVLASAE